jgi:hypothetical protein
VRVQHLHAADKVGTQAKFHIRFELDDAANSFHQRICCEACEIRFSRFTFFERSPRDNAAYPRLRARHVRHPFRLLLELRGITLTLDEHHLRHLDAITRAPVVLDKMIFVQLRNARQPRIFQPLEIPNVQVRVDDGEGRHRFEL